MNVLPIPSDLQKRILDDKERIVISSPDGIPIAALIPLDDLEYLREIEDARDAEFFKEAKNDAMNEPTISWANLKKELNL